MFADVLFPHLHAFGVLGGSTVDPSRLAAGHHDPSSRGFNFNQGIEPGFSLRAGEHFEAFATGLIAYDRAESGWDYELEEAFGKIKELPGGFEFRGGRYLNRFGHQNARHPHGWDFIDHNLVNGLFLGEDGLATDGGEISWNLPTPFASVMSLSYGKVRAHDHDHGHDHGHHEAEEGRFDGEGAVFSGKVAAARWLARHAINDFHQMTGGFSWAGGDNDGGRRTNVFGVDFEYLWRENGLEPGGRAFRWNTEIFIRRAKVEPSRAREEEHEHGHGEDHGHHEEDGRRTASFTQTGFSTLAVWTPRPEWDLGLRVEWVEGEREAGWRERWRVSPAVTFRPGGERRTTQFRLQYNYDHGGDFGEAHSVWFQAGFNFGGAEVR